MTARELFAEAPDDQQPVVDREPQPEDRDDIDREHADLGELADQPQGGE